MRLYLVIVVQAAGLVWSDGGNMFAINCTHTVWELPAVIKTITKCHPLFLGWHLKLYEVPHYARQGCTNTLVSHL